MKSSKPRGGVIHTYQRYDPIKFPRPTERGPDLASYAFEHMLAFGSMRRLTEEELARAVRLDPSQIKGLLPNLSGLIEMLLERKRKILSTYETETVQEEAGAQYYAHGMHLSVPARMYRRYIGAFKREQLAALERLWYRLDQRSAFARGLVHLMHHLGNKYQIDELAAKYDFTGRTPLTIEEALQVKEELETIDRLLEQLREAAEHGQIGIIDLEELEAFAEPGAVEQLRQLQEMLEEHLRQLARRQGLDFREGRYHLTPKAYRLFQSRILGEIFSELSASRSGRHQGPVSGDGAVETPRTKPYEFGDSTSQMDISASFVNGLIRTGPGLPVRLKPEDIEVHITRNTPKCATVVLLDMSGSMRWDGRYIDAKRMGLALDGLIHKEYPGDYLAFIEIYTFARVRHVSEIPELMPKPVTLSDPVVRLRADMGRPDIHEFQIPPHFTNIQHGLALARHLLAAQDTPNRHAILITDGLPTAHFEGTHLFLLYPPDLRTQEATVREGRLARRDGIIINTFLLSNYFQTRRDVQFARDLAESTGGRIFYVGGHDLDRYVLWDYVRRRRAFLG
ncbi:MAG: hypothetical protein AMS14_07595 [Planctomycetes bacterium DG_20]|nr:MAG: hypothetical protein AMS14_07595 [Planctomycetes bacterium DG_20]